MEQHHSLHLVARRLRMPTSALVSFTHLLTRLIVVMATSTPTTQRYVGQLLAQQSILTIAGLTL